jgi:hypothetical protein
MYTIRQKNKTVSVEHNQRHYVLGFKNAMLARKVHYNLHPQPKFILIRDDNPIDLKPHLDIDVALNLEVASTLFIPKFTKGSIWDPMNDGMFHLHQIHEVEFFSLPLAKNLGIIVPYKLEDETSDDFMFKVYMLDPPRI